MRATTPGKTQEPHLLPTMGSPSHPSRECCTSDAVVSSACTMSFAYTPHTLGSHEQGNTQALHSCTPARETRSKEQEFPQRLPRPWTLQDGCRHMICYPHRRPRREARTTSASCLPHDVQVATSLAFADASSIAYCGHRQPSAQPTYNQTRDRRFPNAKLCV